MSSSNAARGPAKPVVAQTALLYLLSTNVDLFNVCVDQCYAAEPLLSRAYFQVWLDRNTYVTARQAFACHWHL